MGLTQSVAPKWLRDLLLLITGFLLVAGVLGAALEASDSAASGFGSSTQTIGSADKFTADGSFRAAFPEKPSKRVRRVAESGAQVEVAVYTATDDGNEFFIASIPLEPGLPFDINLVASQVAGEINGTLQSKTPTTFQGFPAVEVVIAKGDELVRELLVRSTGQFLQIGASGSLATYERFRDSVEILS